MIDNIDNAQTVSLGHLQITTWDRSAQETISTQCEHAGGEQCKEHDYYPFSS